jgi:gluconolactonase
VANTSIPIINANGGYFFNGRVDFVDGRGDSETTILIDSYFGLPFNGPNDIVWVKTDTGPFLFFTDDPLSSVYDGGPLPSS